MHVLVTGAAGMLGRKLVARLVGVLVLAGLAVAGPRLVYVRYRPDLAGQDA